MYERRMLRRSFKVTYTLYLHMYERSIILTLL
uniref:Uncharacterized protein n=1 Tax=Arundo donax TaxID=35708 RepID=A0A0A9AKJ1_ARUDO